MGENANERIGEPPQDSGESISSPVAGSQKTTYPRRVPAASSRPSGLVVDAMIHMCGHVRDILADIGATGLDGIDALTPPQTGNTTPEDAWEVIGSDLIVHGVLDPSTWIHRSKGDITAAMDHMLLPGMKEKNFLLCTAADGLPDIPRETWGVLADAWDRFSAR